jgi:tRNA nucleotidyltransferase/poly(A) polymerase
LTLNHELFDEWGRTVLRACRDASTETDSTVYLVGGPVRDLLRGVAVSDPDLAVDGHEDDFARRLAGLLSARLTSNDRFLTWRLDSDSNRHVDLAQVRTETYTSPGSLPKVAPATSITEDLARRDFTVNAMAIRLNDEQIVDPFSGRDDLRAGLLRTLHEQSFHDDPTRIFRAIRLAERCRLTIERLTAEAMDEAIRHGAIGTVSRDRIWKEIDLACSEAEPTRVLRTLADRRCLETTLGPVRSESLRDLPARLDVTGSVDVRIILLGALTRGCPPTTFDSMPLDRSSIAKIRAIADRAPTLAESLRLVESSSEQYDFCEASSREERALASLEDPGIASIVTRFDQAVATGRAIRGDELGVKPGPWIGRAIRDTTREVFAGGIEPGDVSSFARRLALQYLGD